MTGVHFTVGHPVPVPIVLTTGQTPRVGDTAVDHITGGRPSTVTSTTGETITLQDGTSGPVSQFAVAAHGIEPVPARFDTIATAGTPEGATHRLISGENAHATPLLEAEGVEPFDVIYLDPPYDTSGQLSYRDSRDDWADFFHARLVRVRPLLRPRSGVLIIAIDDRRAAWARLIADHVMGAASFVTTVVWDGGVKGQSRLVSTAHDYMLIYVADPAWYHRERVKWREAKPGVTDAITAAGRLWDGNPETSRARMLAWYDRLGDEHPARRLRLYSYFDTDGRLFREGPVSKPGGGGYDYDVTHPVTGLPVQPPSTGWRYSPERMRDLLRDDRIVFRSDHTSCVATKLFLDEQRDQVAGSVFTEVRTRAAKRLAAQVGERVFTFPKDTTVLARWFHLVTRGDRDARFLDVFAGSGSTAHTVMEMNAADGGRRTSVSVTNNEVPATVADGLIRDGVLPGSDEWEAHGLFERVARPRLEGAAVTLGQHVIVERLTLGVGDVAVDVSGRTFPNWSGSGVADMAA